MSHSGALYVLFCFTWIDDSPEPTSKNKVPRLIAVFVLAAISLGTIFFDVGSGDASIEVKQNST